MTDVEVNASAENTPDNADIVHFGRIPIDKAYAKTINSILQLSASVSEATLFHHYKFFFFFFAKLATKISVTRQQLDVSAYVFTKPQHNK